MELGPMFVIESAVSGADELPFGAVDGPALETNHQPKAEGFGNALERAARRVFKGASGPAARSGRRRSAIVN